MVSLFENLDDDSPPILSHLCPYVSAEVFLKKLNKDSISMVSMNVRSLSGKRSELCNFLGSNNDNILIVLCLILINISKI